jgi:alpha-beta hydrolase superfamily lysophospholipase
MIDKAILVCPLVRSYLYRLSVTGNNIIRPFLKNMRRAKRNSTSDKEYLKFTSKDPLQFKTVPLSWFESLIRWNAEITGYQSSNIPVFILQGSKDTIVDYRYNLEFLKKKFNEITIKHYQEGNHHLLNEREDLKEVIYTEINNYLKQE